MLLLALPCAVALTGHRIVHETRKVIDHGSCTQNEGEGTYTCSICPSKTFYDPRCGWVCYMKSWTVTYETGVREDMESKKC